MIDNNIRNASPSNFMYYFCAISSANIVHNNQVYIIIFNNFFYRVSGVYSYYPPISW